MKNKDLLNTQTQKSPIRIGIDARLIIQTGVGRYIRNLLEELPKLDFTNEYFIYLRKEDYHLFTTPGKNWHKIVLDVPWHTLREQIQVPLALLKDHLDVMHFPYFNVPVLYPGKYLLTVHDLIVDHFNTGRASTLPPILYQLKRSGYSVASRSGAKRAQFITTISRTTQNELENHYGLKPDKITVTYDALDNLFLSTVRTHKPVKLFNFPYILYVGNAYPHKNLEKLVSALMRIRKNRNMKLVLAGDDDFFFPRLEQFVRNLGMEDQVIFSGRADDKKLVNLYSFSECLVFPSLMEGFGLPNLEVLACNRLPVISDIPVFREVWGTRLPVFDPSDINDMAAKIIEVLNYSKSEYSQKVMSAKKRISDFSWRSTAEATLKLYGKINKS